MNIKKILQSIYKNYIYKTLKYETINSNTTADNECFILKD